MIITDIHNHTAFSSDGRASAEQMLATAYEKGIKYYGVADHFNFDYALNNVREDMVDVITNNPERYFVPMRKLQEEYEGKMTVLVGGEFGFTRNPKSNEMALNIIKDFNPDFVVNSVHTIGRFDYCEKGAYIDDAGKLLDKKTVYNEYFKKIRDSLDVPYHYDVVAHSTYCTRYAPYDDKRATLKEFGDIIDDILNVIIKRDKILEVNASNNGAPSNFIPSDEVIERYYELGGRMISYASDAHLTAKVAFRRDEVVEYLKKVGFKYLTIPYKKNYIQVQI